ncbi:MAG: class B sortase [Erysipelotrichaceae bacterium]|nr:class B sortase [Erysipelotrichaceae bacterium]
MKKSGIREWIRRLLLIICICVFCYSAYQLISIYLNYKNIEDQTSELIDTYVEESEDEEDLDAAARARKIDFDALLERNEDVIGWLYIPDTNIDEPILKGEDNDTYIHTSIDGEYLSAGSIFVEETNSDDFSDDMTIIYGHNMRNGSRFHDIRYYDDEVYYKEHQSIYIYTLDGNINIYEIFSAKVVDPEDECYTTVISDYASYVENAQSDAQMTSDIDTTNQQPLIMLSTCWSQTNTKRNIVFAYLSEVYER